MLHFEALMLLFRTMHGAFRSAMVLFRTMHGAFRNGDGAVSHHAWCVSKRRWCDFASCTVGWAASCELEKLGQSDEVALAERVLSVRHRACKRARHALETGIENQ